MVYYMIAQALGNAAWSHLQSWQQAVNANQQNLQQYEQQTYQLEDMASQDQAQVEANTQNTILANYKAGIIGIQQGQALAQNAKQSMSITEAGLGALGAQNANAAAAGSVGASVRAVSNDIQMQADTAQIANAENADTIRLNFDTQMHDLYANLNNAIQIPTVGHASDPISISGGLTWYQSMGMAAVGIASQYAQSKMNLSSGSGSDSNYNSYPDAGGSTDASTGSSFMGSVE